MIDVIIMILIVAWVSGAFGRRGKSKDRKASGRKNRNLIETLRDEFESGSSADELRQWMDGKRTKEAADDSEDTASESPQNQWGSMGGQSEADIARENQWGSMGGYQENIESSEPPEQVYPMFKDEADEYEYRVERAYSEQGMPGDLAAETTASESMKDVRLVKRSKPRIEPYIAEQQQLLKALGDLPSAIVAAEVLGPPRAMRGRRR